MLTTLIEEFTNEYLKPKGMYSGVIDVKGTTTDRWMDGLSVYIYKHRFEQRLRGALYLPFVYQGLTVTLTDNYTEWRKINGYLVKGNL